MREEVEAQAVVTTKAKRATELAELESDHLRLELLQSSDREADIRAKGCEAVKTIQDKLDPEVVSHGRMREERDKLHEEGTKKEATRPLLRRYEKRHKRMSVV